MQEIIEQDSALSSVVNRVTQEGERVRVKVGEQEIAVVSIEDLAFLEEIESKLDLLDALEALQEATRDKKIIPWEDLLQEIQRSRQSDDL